jgi:hypothetical protein
MDPVTHTLVGVTAANALFRRRIGREAVPILALALRCFYPRVARARGTRLGRRLEAFFKAPVWQIHGNPSTGSSGPGSAVEVTGADLRFRSLVLNRPPAFLCCFRVPPEGEVGACR